MGRIRWTTVGVAFSVTAVACAVAYVVWRYEPSGWPAFLLEEDSHPALFLGLMAVLPVVGFPISVFLLLAGTKFGLAGGMAITAALVAFHLVLSFLLARSMLRPFMVNMLRRFDVELPKPSRGRVGVYTFVFMAIPGLPYAVKNYALVLYGVPLRYYFGIGWSVNLMLGLPVVGLGAGAARLDLRIAAVFLVLLLAGYGIIRWLRARLTRGTAGVDTE